MSIESIIAALTGVLVGAVLSFIFCKIRTDNIKEQLAEKVASHEKELETFKKNTLSVVTYPYKEEHGDSGFFSDERRAEIGYKFQVFVSGVPCFEAHKVVTDVLSKKQVNQERVDQAMEQAFILIETFASKHPAFIAMKSAPLSKAKLV